MTLRQQAPSIVVSLALHATLLAVLGWIVLERPISRDLLALDTILHDEDRSLHEVVRDLDTQTEIAETINFTPGGLPADAAGADSKPVSQQQIELEDVVRPPEVQVHPGAETLPEHDTFALELNYGEVLGQVGAVVDGYGPALDQLTQELIRLMRTDPLLVVWLFDESESMKDDQKEITERLDRVYQELGIVEQDARALGGRQPRRLDDVLLTAVHSFGERVRQHTEQPTGRRGDVLAAIDRLPVDPSGIENMGQALLSVIGQYRTRAARDRRRLVVIVVSDESGDDGELVEDVIQEARRARAPIYILGREAVFGSLYAHVRWRQPETGRIFYLPIRRGPETPFAEQLQFDGYRARRDSHMSGFGPCEQVRICRETGGIFFQLPHEEQDLNDLDARRSAMLDLREYLPDVDSRRKYATERDGSRFRRAIWDVIVLLNPYQPGHDWLNLPDPEFEREVFTTDPGEYMPRVMQRVQQMDRILAAMRLAEQRLEEVRPLRSREPSMRWRANYDLITAQLPWYRVRLFEYAISLHQFALKGVPAAVAKNPQHNRWQVRESPSEWILPDADQEKLFKITAADLQQAHDAAVARLEEVQQLHPGTPWARRAEWELRRKFGATFRTWHQGPPQPGRPQPTPTPPPRL